MWGRAQSQGPVEFTTGVWRVSKELQQICLEVAQWRSSQACCASRDGTWQRSSECTLQPLGTHPHRKGKAGSTRKSFCSPHSRGVSQVMAPEKHPLCCGPGQQTPNVLVEWRRLLQEPAQEQHSTAEPRGPHGRRELGVSKESGISDPQSPYSRMGERRDETFPVHWRTMEKPQQEGRWSCWCPTELLPHRS